MIAVLSSMLVSSPFPFWLQSRLSEPVLMAAFGLALVMLASGALYRLRAGKSGAPEIRNSPLGASELGVIAR